MDTSGAKQVLEALQAVKEQGHLFPNCHCLETSRAGQGVLADSVQLSAKTFVVCLCAYQVDLPYPLMLRDGQCTQRSVKGSPRPCHQSLIDHELLMQHI